MDEDTRFRRALKSPLVVGGLCICAGLAVYRNGMGPTMDSSIPISVASIPSPAVPAQAISASGLQVHDDVATQWVENPKRDPFAPISITTWSKPLSKSPAASASPNDRPHTQSSHNFLLKAVAIEAQRRSAVINRQVVYEGEMIEGYQVVSIQLKGVWLQRHGKKEFLTFATNTTS